jgi:DNA-binding ferritin-like protein
MPITLEKFNALMDLWKSVLQDREEILTQAVEKSLEEYLDRIFERGEDSEGDQIGSYSVTKIGIMKNRMINPSAKTDQLGYEKPKSVSLVFDVLQRYGERIQKLEQQIEKLEEGKTKNQLKARLRKLEKYKAKLERKTKIQVSYRGTGKTAYFKRGYKQFRAVQGLKVDKVYLKYSGYLKNSFEVRYAATSGAEILLYNKPNLKNPPGIDEPPNVIKLIQHFERKYRTIIFSPAEKEKDACYLTMSKGIIQSLKKYAQGKSIQIL